jgi:hypothetical protein
MPVPFTEYFMFVFGSIGEYESKERIPLEEGLKDLQGSVKWFREKFGAEKAD